jgi:hypothetical protein
VPLAASCLTIGAKSWNLPPDGRLIAGSDHARLDVTAALIKDKAQPRTLLLCKTIHFTNIWDRSSCYLNRSDRGGAGQGLIEDRDC